MENVQSIIETMQSQSSRQISESAEAQRKESVASAIFSMKMELLQARRAQENTTKTQMVDILSDVMTVLKKNGDQIRQSGS